MPLKIRKNRSGAEPPGCQLAHCMSLINGAWTPHVIWHLRGGPRRFSELRIDIPAVSAKVLTTRLRELEAKGVLTRAVLPTSPPSVEYALTALGRELGPVIQAIVDVSGRLKASAG